MTKLKRRTIIAKEDFYIKNEYGLDEIKKGELIDVDDKAFNKLVNKDKLCMEKR